MDTGHFIKGKNNAKFSKYWPAKKHKCVSAGVWYGDTKIQEISKYRDSDAGGYDKY